MTETTVYKINMMDNPVLYPIMCMMFIVTCPIAGLVILTLSILSSAMFMILGLTSIISSVLKIFKK
jgi:hypothetical protein